MRTLNFTGTKRKIYIEDESVLNIKESLQLGLAQVYSDINDERWGADESASILAKRMMRYAPSSRAIRVIIPDVTDELAKAIVKKLSGTNYIPIKLTGGKDSLGSANWKLL